MQNPTVILKKGEGRTLKAGGLWVYDNEIDRILGSPLSGDIVQVADFDGFPLGTGFINEASRIRVRLLSRDPHVIIDEVFFEKRLKDAWEYRKRVTDTSACRLVFGEADYLPGLVIDKFSDVLVVQSLALGIDRYKEMIVRLQRDLLRADGIEIRGVYERSDAGVRRQEGMEPVKGFLSDPFPTLVEISENGVRYQVDVENGQKTGFFLDQKINRQAVGRLCKNADVLDCFTHTGSFALNAGAGGAARVLGIDASETAVAQAEANARLNGMSDRVSFICRDIFDCLPQLEAQGNRYAVVILDPPAFTKSRSSVKSAVRGYREINHRGMRLVKDGGFLATCSCSHFMDQELFAATIAQAAAKAHRRLRQVYFGTQAPDHPIPWGGSESYYLKFYIFQVLGER